MGSNMDDGDDDDDGVLLEFHKPVVLPCKDVDVWPWSSMDASKFNRTLKFNKNTHKATAVELVL